MWDWIYRWRLRKRDLQEGVDADLVQANRQRWKLCALLFGLSFASIGIQAIANFRGQDRIPSREQSQRGFSLARSSSDIRFSLVE